MILGNSMAALAHRACKFLASCVVLAGACAVAQTGTPATPTPIQTPQSQTGTPGYVIKARVPLTILDIVVTDAKGRPVHGLKQTDFTILEDKQEVKPNSFEEHRADEAGAAGSSTPVKKELGPNTFSNTAPTVSDRALNVLLLDSLNTPMSAQSYVLKQMTGFLDKLPAGTPLEILGLSPKGLTILQGLTTDRELLKAAISGKNGLPQLVPLGDPEAPASKDELETPEEQGAITGVRAANEIVSMKEIARYLSGIPGRKNLLWFSGSFPLQFPPQPPDPDVWPISLMYDDEDTMKAAAGLLARARVAVYPLDPRVLEGLPMKSRRGEILIAEHGTMDDLAEQTGGRAFYNTNGIFEAAQEALDEGANFYTVTYTPLNQALDTRFRTISVKVDQPGLKLIYRDGYYAVDPATTLAGKQAQPQATAMQSAMLRGALQPTQILFQVKVAQAAGTEMTLPVSNKPDAKQMKPPYRHYSLAFLVDVNNIEFSQSIDGNYRGDFEFGVMVYNGNDGAVANTASKTVSPILPPAVYNSMRRGGANARLEIDVPAAGEYFLRIGVHDLISDRVGAVEIPVSSITPETAPAVTSEK
jgi:VWFA-related protein